MYQETNFACYTWFRGDNASLNVWGLAVYNQLFLLDSQLSHQLGNRLYQITALLISWWWQERIEKGKKSIRSCPTWSAEHMASLLNLDIALKPNLVSWALQGDVPQVNEPSWSQRLFWRIYFSMSVIISLWQDLLHSRISLVERRKGAHSTRAVPSVIWWSNKCLCAKKKNVCGWGKAFAFYVQRWTWVNRVHFGWQIADKLFSPVQGTEMLQNRTTIGFSTSFCKMIQDNSGNTKYPVV